MHYFILNAKNKAKCEIPLVIAPNRISFTKKYAIINSSKARLGVFLVSEDPQKTYSARDIVLEFFPATPKRFIPEHLNYQLSNHAGQFVLINRADEVLLKLEPVSPSGKNSLPLCCDFCQNNASREFIQLFRAEKPGSKGRQFFYVSLCKNTAACEVRRINDKPVEKLLKRVGVLD